MNIRTRKLLAILLLGGSLIITSCANTSSGSLQSVAYSTDEDADDENTAHLFYDEEGNVIAPPATMTAQDGSDTRHTPPARSTTNNANDDD